MALEQWTDLLTSIDIPEEDSRTYAAQFISNSITQDDLQDLDKETLIGMKITVLGHQLKIKRLGKNLSQQKQPMSPDSTSTITSNYKSPSASASAKLPNVTPDMTMPQFRKFLIDWDVYTTITKIPASERTAHLYSACDNAVQNSLINANPSFLTLQESVALKIIQSLVTERSNPAVHRKAFTSIQQSETESIQDFLVRIQTAATDCEFTCPSCEFDLSTLNIRDQFIRGLNNSNIQTDILSKANQLKTLVDTVNHAKAIESALRDQSQIEHSKKGSDHVYGAKEKGKKFQYKQKSTQFEKFQQSNKCIGCGDNTHSNREREKKCPAWGHQCSNCGRENHYEKVCFRPSQSKVGGFDLIAHVKYQPDTKKYSSLSKNSEEIAATLTPRLSGNQQGVSSDQMVFPDSGASICLGGTDHLPLLQIDLKDLIPCNKKVSAVGGSTLVCKGWLPVEFIF